MIDSSQDEAVKLEALLVEWERLEQAFHDAVPDQGDPGDGGVAGRALCQFVYDHSDTFRAALSKPAALPKGEDLEQLIQDARVAACGTRLTCREREVIRALCDAVEARAALAPPPQAQVE